MKFNLSDFEQLDTKELRAVNGGTDCHGGSSNYGSSRTSSSGGSCSGKYGTS